MPRASKAKITNEVPKEEGVVQPQPQEQTQTQEEPVTPRVPDFVLLAQSHALRHVTAILRQGSYASLPGSNYNNFSHRFFMAPMLSAYEKQDKDAFLLALSTYLQEAPGKVPHAGKREDVPDLVEAISGLIDNLGERGLLIVGQRLLSTMNAPV